MANNITQSTSDKMREYLNPNIQEVQLTGINATKITSDGSQSGTTPYIGGTSDNAGDPNAIHVANRQLLYNESGWDRVRNNTGGILLASAVRTSSIQAPTVINYNSRGVIVFVDVNSLSGTSPSLQLQLQAKDPATGLLYGYASAFSPITTTGAFTFVVYPSTLDVPASGGKAQLPLPRNFSFYFGVGGTSPSIDFSAGYSLIL